MQLSHKYKPLFKLLREENPEVDIVIMTGGRLSGKSFAASTFINEAIIQHEWSILHTRYTTSSLQDSVKKEMVEKMDMLKTRQYYNVLQDRASCTLGKGNVVWKGIKAGSGGQTANLKSLSGLNCLVVDEAEELPDLETFSKVYYSIRSNEKRNVSILIMNPVGRDHWIYQHFFKKRNVPDGFNGIIDNVMYINSTYLDLNREVIPDSIYNDYERMKVDDPQRYKDIILGSWLSEDKGKVYSRGKLNRFSLPELNMESVEHTIALLDPANQGTDYLAYGVFGIVDKNCYLLDVVFTQDDSNTTIPMIVNLTNHYNPQYMYVENNGVGSMFADAIQPLCEDTAVIDFHQSSNKHAKIVSGSGFVKKNLYFRDDIEAGSEYDQFIDNMLEYNRNKKENNSIHDDAPDLVGEFARKIQEYLEDNWVIYSV